MLWKVSKGKTLFSQLDLPKMNKSDKPCKLRLIDMKLIGMIMREADFNRKKSLLIKKGIFLKKQHFIQSVVMNMKEQDSNKRL